MYSQFLAEVLLNGHFEVNIATIALFLKTGIVLLPVIWLVYVGRHLLVLKTIENIKKEKTNYVKIHETTFCSGFLLFLE